MRWFKKKPLDLVELAGRGNLSGVVDRLGKGEMPDSCGDGSGITPLWIAAANGHEKIVEALLGAGASPNARDPKKGMTALMVSAMRGNGDVVLTLLKRGADANSQTEDGETALMFAVKGLALNALSESHARLQRVIVQTLLMFGADANKKTMFGKSVLDEHALILDQETKRLIQSSTTGKRP